MSGDCIEVCDGCVHGVAPARAEVHRGSVVVLKWLFSCAVFTFSETHVGDGSILDNYFFKFVFV